MTSQVKFEVDADTAKAIDAFLKLKSKIEATKEAGTDMGRAHDSGLKDATRGAEQLQRSYHKVAGAVAFATEALRRQAAAEREATDARAKSMQGAAEYAFTGAPSGIGKRQEEIDVLSAATGRNEAEAARALLKMRAMPEGARQEAFAALQRDATLFPGQNLENLAEIRAMGSQAGLSQTATENLRIQEGSDRAMSIFRSLLAAQKKMGAGARGRAPADLAGILSRRGELSAEDAAAVSAASEPGRNLAGEIAGAPQVSSYQDLMELERKRRASANAKESGANLRAQQTVEDQRAAIYGALGSNAGSNLMASTLDIMPASLQHLSYEQGVQSTWNLRMLLSGQFGKIGSRPPMLPPVVELSPGPSSAAAHTPTLTRGQ